MPFTVNDFQDLLALLGTHPEWRSELRRLVLADELIDLPGLVRDLAAVQLRTDQQLQVLTERVEALGQRMDQLTERVEALGQRMDQLTERVDALAQRMEQVTDRVDSLRGDVIEGRFPDRGPGGLGLLGIRHVRVLSGAERADLASDGIEDGRITEREYGELLRLEWVAHGRDAAGAVWLAVEGSATGDVHDVERAEARSAVLSKLRGRTRPVVAAHRFTQGAQARSVANRDLVLMPLS